jgi:predicted  nucleic acid-binding Zn-ribbon protein
MAVDLRPLIELHFLDQEIATLNGSISTIPAQIQEFEKKLERFHRDVKEKQDLIAANQKKRRELEQDLSLIETKRNRYKEQLDTVKTNKEYVGLQHEIEGVSQAIRQVEDQILAQMEEAEQIKIQMQAVQNVLDTEEKGVLQQKSVVQAEGDRLQGQMDVLKAKRQKLVSGIHKDIIEVYERTASHRRGIAMAEAKNAICQECHMRIRPQLFQEIKRNDSMITCESCSRILFYVPKAGEKPEVQSLQGVEEDASGN